MPYSAVFEWGSNDGWQAENGLVPTRAIYLLTSNRLNLPQILERARDHGKTCLVNIDFLDGLNRDRHVIEFLAGTRSQESYRHVLKR